MGPIKRRRLEEPEKEQAKPSLVKKRVVKRKVCIQIGKEKVWQ